MRHIPLLAEGGAERERDSAKPQEWLRHQKMPRSHKPAVLGPAKINEWLEAVIDVTRQKLAAGQ